MGITNYFPAFPTAQDQKEGITARDYFAAKAMQGLIAKYGDEMHAGMLMERAFIYANIALSERNK